MARTDLANGPAQGSKRNPFNFVLLSVVGFVVFIIGIMPAALHRGECFFCVCDKKEHHSLIVYYEYAVLGVVISLSCVVTVRSHNFSHFYTKRVRLLVCLKLS